jgi:hypothetical protein
VAIKAFTKINRAMEAFGGSCKDSGDSLVRFVLEWQKLAEKTRLAAQNK